MSSQETFDGDDRTLTGKAPAARIFALVILSLAVLLGSLLAVSAIGRHDVSSAVSATPGLVSGDGESGVLVVPKHEPAPKPKPKPDPKPEPKPRAEAPVRVTSAASSSPAASASAPAASPVPAQSAPAPTPAPQAAPKPAAPAPQKKAPVQHTVVVTE